MRIELWMVILFSLLAILTACTDEKSNEEPGDIKMIAVDFELPETAAIDESIELKATVQ